MPDFGTALAVKIDGYVSEKPQALSAEASNAELSLFCLFLQIMSE